MTFDPQTALAFTVHENPGVFALLLGSGISRSAQIPTGWEITIDLIKRIGALKAAGEQTDWAKWYAEQYKKEPDYSDLIDLVAQTADERRAILHKYIEPSAEDIQAGRKTPTKAHRAIAQLVRDGFIKVIITTNFDRLLENALRDVGIEPTVIASDDSLKGALPLVHSKCHLVKVHGDFLDTRIKNTQTELGNYSKPLNALLDRIFDEYGLVVCGWSGEWDIALRKAMQRSTNRRYPLFWAGKGKLAAGGKDLIASRAGKLIPISDADSFFGDLQRKVALQSELQRDDPRSIELLIAASKKYAKKPEHEIALNDLVYSELKRLKAALSDVKQPTNWLDKAEFGRLTARLEAVAEPLVQIFFILGRWGGEFELRLTQEVLQAAAKPHRPNNLELFEYPSVLMLYSFGLGATKAENYRLLFRWLSTQVTDINDRSEPAVTRLFLWGWEKGDNRYWDKLYDVGQKTPLSNHLYEWFGRIHEAHFQSDDAFQDVFDQFELLSSIAHTTNRTTAVDLKATLNSDSGRGYEWCPFGRLGWQERRQELVFPALAQQERASSLLAGGFANGDMAFLADIVRSIQKGMYRLRW